MQKFIVKDNESGQTLEKYVRKVLKDAPLSFIYKLFRKKDVKVDGHWQKEKYVIERLRYIFGTWSSLRRKIHMLESK